MPPPFAQGRLGRGAHPPAERRRARTCRGGYHPPAGLRRVCCAPVAVRGFRMAPLEQGELSAEPTERCDARSYLQRRNRTKNYRSRPDPSSPLRVTGCSIALALNRYTAIGKISPSGDDATDISCPLNDILTHCTPESNRRSALFALNQPVARHSFAKKSLSTLFVPVYTSSTPTKSTLRRYRP